MDRDDFSVNIKEILAKRVGFRCSNPSCRQLTTGPQKNETKTLNVGVAAHITAARSGGPRYNKYFTSSQRKSSANGIWLCQKCAKLIDNDTVRYTVDIINSWKAKSEETALREIEGNSLNLDENSTFVEKKISAYEKLHYAVQNANKVVQDLFDNETMSVQEKNEIAFLAGLEVATITDDESFYLDEEVTVQAVAAFVGLGSIFKIQPKEQLDLEIEAYRRNVRNTFRMIESIKKTGKLDISIQTPIVKYFKHQKSVQEKEDLED